MLKKNKNFHKCQLKTDYEKRQEEKTAAENSKPINNKVKYLTK